MEEANDYSELPQQMSQDPLHPTALASPDYSTINEYATPGHTVPTNDTSTQLQASHEYFVIERPEELSAYATSEYALPTCNNGITTQTKPNHEYFVLERPEELSNQHTASDPPQYHQNETATDNHNTERSPVSHNETLVTTDAQEANETINSERDPQVGATYSTVVRQDGKKVTIRIQAPAACDEHRTS